MNRRDLVRTVAARTGVPLAAAAAAIDAVTGAIADGLAAGERVTVRRFGRFEAFTSPPKRAVDPNTRLPVPVPPRVRVSFRSAPALRARIRP